MSMATFGTLAPSHWSYMAAVMANSLDEILSVERSSATSIPRGVYEDAKRFFTLALQSRGDNLADDPPLSMNVYATAVDVANSLAHGSVTEVDDRLQRYATFLTGLEVPHPLSDEERGGSELKGLFSSPALRGRDESTRFSSEFARHPRLEVESSSRRLFRNLVPIRAPRHMFGRPFACDSHADQHP